MGEDRPKVRGRGVVEGIRADRESTNRPRWRWILPLETKNTRKRLLSKHLGRVLARGKKRGEFQLTLGIFYHVKNANFAMSEISNVLKIHIKKSFLTC
jgi:hypothetical protein